MEALDWIKTASNHAVINKAELCQWLSIPARDLLVLVRNDQRFPRPRFGAFRTTQDAKNAQTIPTSCRWRVGDIRAWLEGSARLEKELATEVMADSNWRQDHPWKRP
jgi:hypothetical protein